jgi:hypothetical protein
MSELELRPLSLLAFLRGAERKDRFGVDSERFSWSNGLMQKPGGAKAGMIDLHSVCRITRIISSPRSLSQWNRTFQYTSNRTALPPMSAEV